MSRSRRPDVSNAGDGNAASPDLTLFGAGYGVYTRIVRICLKEKRLAFRFVETDIFDADVKQEHLSRHPFGKIPVLRCANDVVIEAGAIVRFLDALQPEPRLFPDILLDAACAEQTIEVINSYGCTGLVWKVYVPWKRARDKGEAAPDFSNIAAEIEACLSFLDGRMTGRGYFSGSNFGAADALVYPVLAYFQSDPWGREQVELYSSLRWWFERVAPRPSISDTNFQDQG